METIVKIEDLKPKAKVRGILPHEIVSIENVDYVGKDAATVVFKDKEENISSKIIFADNLEDLQIVSDDSVWTFDADGERIKMAIEANRIRLAYHFDPYLAIHTSIVNPLPHQITAVYGNMLSRQPLRFLLADDVGSGKTIMAGLLIKELIARGDLERCLIIVPGSLVEQWQDELWEKFSVDFSILSRETIELSRSGNPFNDSNMIIARLDMLARDDELQYKIQHSDEWDMIIVDEAHRMSASVYGGDVNKTKRYQLGEKLESISRHLLLLSATPHNGKEKDFQLFMALLDKDRYEGSFRDVNYQVDAKDMMRRFTKEELLTFDGKPLFPERRAYTAKYKLSDAEHNLYMDVTEYVRTEMNRVERFVDSGSNKVRINVGFALQILQRRLASSPAAICYSLERRKQKLEEELRKAITYGSFKQTNIDKDTIDDISCIDEYDSNEIDNVEGKVLATATAAGSIEQLKAEILTLGKLESKAREILVSGKDTKWIELSKILDDELMVNSQGVRRKLIIFTEARDTLLYLSNKIESRLGKPNAVEVIHGGVSRDQRRRVVQRFMQDKELLILVANDAAGEGINLQRGHLMVNYDLPWNPNKIEQRFGRIHRIGQTEICHLWNLVAADTKEGEVYTRLLEKLDVAREALGGRVFDVLGNLFENNSLKDLLWDAIQSDKQGKPKKRDIIEDINIEYIKKIIDDHKLTNDVLPEDKVQEIRLDLEKAEAHRLQPYHIEGFFLEAFQKLGGKIKSRENGRYEITYIPFELRREFTFNRRVISLLKRYERICFDKKFINQSPVAVFVCPGHPLLDIVIDVVNRKNAHLLKKGAVMVDEFDFSEKLEILFLIEHEIHDGRTNQIGKQTISKRMQFARLDADGCATYGGIAPHLDLRPASNEEIELVAEELNASWLKKDIEEQIKSFSIRDLAKKHHAEITERRIPEIKKIEKEVKKRLKQEIRYWDMRATKLRDKEKTGEKTRLSAQNAQRRADNLEERLKNRINQLELEKVISALPPVIRGGLAVIPKGLLDKKKLNTVQNNSLVDRSMSKKEVELLAMEAVMDVERRLGYDPEDRSAYKEGYDIISFDTKKQEYRFIEVKGRVEGSDTVTVTKNEIITGLNKGNNFALAIVEIESNTVYKPRYVWNPFDMVPSTNCVSVIYNLHDFYNKAVEPS